jgi:5'-3' exoribonuclease 2
MFDSGTSGVMLTSRTSDPLLAMVLSVPLRAFRCRFQRYPELRNSVHAGQAFQAVRTTDGSLPCCKVRRPIALSRAPLSNTYHVVSRLLPRSKKHLPEPYQKLMTEEDSPILDFYPPDFEIDMNGKKMAWQGIALLPFISQDRLLGAIATVEPLLTPDERRRNTTGNNVMLISEDNDLYPKFCELYTKKKATQVSLCSGCDSESGTRCLIDNSFQPVPIDGKLSRGICGSVLQDEDCIPGASLDTPLKDVPECPDISDNRSLSVRYWFPKQLRPHQSKLLPGLTPPRTILNEQDREQTRTGRRGGYGGRGRGRGGGPGGGGYNTPSQGSGYSTPTYSSPARGGYGGGNYQASGAQQGYRPSPAYGGAPGGYAGGNAGAGYGLGGTGAYNAGAAYGGYGGYGGGAPAAYQQPSYAQRESRLV